LPSLKLSNRTLNSTCFFVENDRLAMPEVMRVVDGSPRKTATWAAAPKRNPEDGFEPMIGAATIILWSGSLGGAGPCGARRG
jgi:hypothetical protein